MKITDYFKFLVINNEFREIVIQETMFINLLNISTFEFQEVLTLRVELMWEIKYILLIRT